MKTDQVFDISSDDSPFRLKNHTYQLGGGFKIVCDVSQNIHCFDVYHDGYPIGTVDVKMANCFFDQISEAHKENKIIALTISIRSNKKAEKLQSNYFIGSSFSNNIIGTVWFCNKNGGTVFEPMLMEIDSKELPHVYLERKVLFEKYREPKPKVNLKDYIFGIDVGNELDRLYVHATRIHDINEDARPIFTVDHFPKLEA